MRGVKGVALNQFLRKKMPAVAWLDLLINVLYAVRELHKSGVLHCDLKLENIYYDLVSHKAVIINHDLAVNNLSADTIVQGIQRDHAYGTLANMSPEAQRGFYSEKSEIFALGLVFAEMLDLAVSHKKYNVAAGRRIDVLEINKEDSDTNDKIPDSNTRKVILSILRNMVHKNNRLTLQSDSERVDLIQYFKAIRAEYIDAPGMIFVYEDKHASTSRLADKHFTKLIASLDKEIVKLYYDGTEERTQLINGAKATLEKNNQQKMLTVAKAIRQVDKLQTNMLLTQQSQLNFADLMTELNELLVKKAIRSAAKPQPTHSDVMRQLHTIDKRSGMKKKSARVTTTKKMPPPLPKEFAADLPPPPLVMDVTANNRQSSLPSALQAELAAQKNPDYQSWNFQKTEYTDLIHAVINQINQSVAQSSNDKLQESVAFYMDLINSTNTLFQKAVVMHSLISNKDSRFNELKIELGKDVLEKEKAYFHVLLKLCPRKPASFFHALEKAAISNNPSNFKNRKIQQLEELDPTPENRMFKNSRL